MEQMTYIMHIMRAAVDQGIAGDVILFSLLYAEHAILRWLTLLSLINTVALILQGRSIQTASCHARHPISLESSTGEGWWVGIVSTKSSCTPRTALYSTPTASHYGHFDVALG
jgi:hypothetical protein